MTSKCIVAAIALAACVALPSLAVAQPVDSLSGVEVTNVTSSGDRVSGTIVNRSRSELKDIALLVTRAWLWRDERHPGTENPGGSYYFTVKTPVAPGSSLPFSFDIPHADSPSSQLGQFQVSIQATGYTEVYPSGM